MFKKLSCFLLILTILFSAVSCAKKADTEPFSEQSTSVSAESDEVTTTSDSEKETENNKEEKKSTKKGEEKESTKKDKEKNSSKKSEKSKTDNNKSKAKKNNKPKKAHQKKSSPKKDSPKSQTTTKKHVTTTKKADKISVNITVDCTAAVTKVEGIPNYYLHNFEIDLEKGSTAYSATKAACAKAGISLIATKTMYGEYISAIGSLAEKATSSYSGWTYTVNGDYPPRAADKYTLENGDTIKWIYKA